MRLLYAEYNPLTNSIGLVAIPQFILPVAELPVGF